MRRVRPCLRPRHGSGLTPSVHQAFGSLLPIKSPFHRSRVRKDHNDPESPPGKWQRNGSSTELVLTAVLALVLSGCALPATPLSKVDPAGRASATVDAEKLGAGRKPKRQIS